MDEPATTNFVSEASKNEDIDVVEQDEFSAFATTNSDPIDEQDDDEFGDFGDFKSGGRDSLVNDFGDNDAVSNTSFVVPDEFAQFAGSVSAATQEGRSSDLPSIDLTNASSETILSQFTGILDKLFPSPSLTNFQAYKNESIDNFESQKSGASSELATKIDPETILNAVPEGMKMWQQLAPDSDLTPFLWKKSNIRKKFYTSLGVPSVNEKSSSRRSNSSNVSPPSTTATVLRSASTGSKKAASTPSSRSTTPEPLPEQSRFSSSTTSLATQKRMKIGTTPSSIPKSQPEIDFELVKSLCAISPDTLATYSISDLKSLTTQLTHLTRKTSDLLTYWLDLREQTQMDSETYNQMIECLVGHAQKIRDGNGGKDSNGSKGGKGTRKKNSGKVASGLASLSLSFAKQKFSTNSPKTSSPKVPKNNEAERTFSF